MTVSVTVLTDTVVNMLLKLVDDNYVTQMMRWDDNTAAERLLPTLYQQCLCFSAVTHMTVMLKYKSFMKCRRAKPNIS